jgi:hypothetical protein
MKQIEIIKDFATTLEHFYNRLEQSPSSQNKRKEEEELIIKDVIGNDKNSNSRKLTFVTNLY